MKKIKFIRWGSLSSKIQDGYLSENKIKKLESGEDFVSCFHKPPATRGIYCFIHGFVEMFLVGWKLYDEDEKLKKEYLHPKKFEYSGKIWTHIFIHSPDITYYRKHHSWYETHTDFLDVILKEEVKRLNKDLNKSENKYGRPDFHSMIRAHKWCSLDHFEIFIEKV